MTRLADRNVLDALRHAMAAKEQIFRAQDAMGRVEYPQGATGRRGSGGLRKKQTFVRRVDRALAKLRSELEAFDRLVRDAQHEDRPLCSCDAFTSPEVGRVGYLPRHSTDCPLYDGPRLFSCGCSYLKVGLGKCDFFDEKGRERVSDEPLRVEEHKKGSEA